jgi:predicted DNA-binding transcriptional regulator AlpA
MDSLRVVDVAELLGVTKQRVVQLAETDPAFPTPAETVPVRRWSRSEIEAWAERRFWGTRRWRVRP